MFLFLADGSTLLDIYEGEASYMTQIVIRVRRQAPFSHDKPNTASRIRSFRDLKRAKSHGKFMCCRAVL